MNTPKRVRSSNFSKEEELMLLEEIKKYKHIIECKTTNKLSNSEKEEAWQRILIHFNAHNTTARTIEQIKAKYENLKSKVRKEMAHQKLYLKGTGGGPSKMGDLDAVSEAVLDIMHLKTVIGLESTSDSDCASYNIVNDHSYIIHPQPSTSSTRFDLLQSDIMMEEIQDEAPGILMELAEQEPLGEKDVPKKLKKKTNKKLHPTIPNPAFSARANYYARKLELLEKAEEREGLLSAERAKREQEEHVKKMALLELEIEIKKKQLAL